MTSSILLPGDAISAPTPSQSGKPNAKPKPLTLGPGLRYTPPSTITATIPGLPSHDLRKNALWLDPNGLGRYVPHAGDLVIGTVHHSSLDTFHVSLAPYTSLATLPQLAFENATRKTRPQLQSGSLVYARVSGASKHVDTELECFYSGSTGKADGLGELTGGMLFAISLGLCRRLMMGRTRDDGGICVLEECGARGLKFEVAVGRNGLVWVKADGVKRTLAVGRALQETDIKALTLDEQEKLVKKIIRDVA